MNWPGVPYVDQVGFEHTEMPLPLSLPLPSARIKGMRKNLNSSLQPWCYSLLSHFDEVWGTGCLLSLTTASFRWNTEMSNWKYEVNYLCVWITHRILEASPDWERQCNMCYRLWLSDMLLWDIYGSLPGPSCAWYPLPLGHSVRIVMMPFHLSDRNTAIPGKIMKPPVAGRLTPSWKRIFHLSFYLHLGHWQSVQPWKDRPWELCPKGL